MMPKPKILNPIARSSGNTVVEYGMIGTIIVAASVAIILVLGTNLNKVFSKLQGQSQSYTMSAASARAAQNGQAASARGMQNVAGNALLNGANNANVLQVAGGNGEFTTMSAEAQVIRFKTPPSELKLPDILLMERNMSDRTFQMAQLEEKLQSLLNFSNNDPSQFMSTQLTFNGQTQPAIAIAVGLQNEAQALMQMQEYLNATGATAADKSKMSALVDKVSSVAAAIYSTTQTMQAQNQQAIASAKAAESAAAAKSFSQAPFTGVTTLTNVIETAQTSNAAQQVAVESSATASEAAATATAMGAPTDTTTAVAVTDTSAGTMCITGTGRANNRKCKPH